MVVGPPLDLESLASVRSFAAAWELSERPLHVLVNNAGANYLTEAYTMETGVARLAQVRAVAGAILPTVRVSIVRDDDFERRSL